MTHLATKTSQAYIFPYNMERDHNIITEIRAVFKNTCNLTSFCKKEQQKMYKIQNDRNLLMAVITGGITVDFICPFAFYKRFHFFYNIIKTKQLTKYNS